MKSFALIFSAVLLAAPQVMACVGCRTPGSTVVEQKTVLAGAGFSWSVLFMLAAVFCLVGFMVSYIIKTCREIDRAKQNP